MKDDTRDADLWELARLTCYLHDLSKIRPEFQFKKPFNGGYHGEKTVHKLCQILLEKWAKHPQP